MRGVSDGSQGQLEGQQRLADCWMVCWRGITGVWGVLKRVLEGYLEGKLGVQCGYESGRNGALEGDRMGIEEELEVELEVELLSGSVLGDLSEIRILSLQLCFF